MFPVSEVLIWRLFVYPLSTINLPPSTISFQCLAMVIPIGFLPLKEAFLSMKGNVSLSVGAYLLDPWKASLSASLAF
jgi:hypothetical protein